MPAVMPARVCLAVHMASSIVTTVSRSSSLSGSLGIVIRWRPSSLPKFRSWMLVAVVLLEPPSAIIFVALRTLVIAILLLRCLPTAKSAPVRALRRLASIRPLMATTICSFVCHANLVADNQPKLQFVIIDKLLVSRKMLLKEYRKYVSSNTVWLAYPE